MKKWTVYLGVAVTALMLSACGGGGSTGAGRPDYKITEETQKKAYDAFISLDTIKDINDLVAGIFDAVEQNNVFRDQDCFTKEVSGAAKVVILNNCIVEEKREGVFKFWSLSDAFGELSLDGNLTKDGSKITFNGLEIKGKKGDQKIHIKNPSKLYVLDDDAFKNFSMSYTDKNISIETDDLEWGANEDGILILKGYIRANITDNKWIRLESSNDLSPEEGAGYLILRGSEDSSLKLSFFDGGIKVYLNDILQGTYDDYDTFEQNYFVKPSH